MFAQSLVKITPEKAVVGAIVRNMGITWNLSTLMILVGSTYTSTHRTCNMANGNPKCHRMT